MDISSDYRDLLRIFNTHKVKYLIVGAYAVIFYSEPRFTKDLDLWIKPDNENAKRAYGALKVFGAPLKNISWKTFTNKNLFYQVGIAPVRVDIIMSLGDADFDVAWEKRKKSKYADVSVNIIGIDELIRSKKAAKRKQDEMDLETLRLARTKSK